MLYPKKMEPSLSAELFRNPGSEYRGAPFWAWNCRLEKDELLWQLEVLKEMGFGGAHMHVRTGMATEYLSDEHMALIKACVEKCREEEMLAWLYDEDRWPSGAAGGIVTKEKKYRARYLLLTPVPYGDPKNICRHVDSSASAKRTENGQLLACYDICLDEKGCLLSGKRIGEQEKAAGTKWYAYLETPNPSPWYNGQTYVNTLDPAAIRRFIEVTYERYRQSLGEDLGGIAPAIFTDEPQFSRKSTLNFPEESKDVILPWTDDLPQTFRVAYGEDLVEKLPELLWELPEGRVSTARYHYHDHTCQRFTEAFARQCGGWCEDHGLMLTGHMMEEPTLESQTHALGEAMRSLSRFQLPGIDMLCDCIELTTAKQAQSTAHQYGREGVLSELYGVTGWDFDFRGHKFQGDWQAALGVTVRVPHLSWVSMEGEAKRDYPASIHYQSPWWRDYRYVEDHFARVNTALTRGKPLVKLGVIHPVESYWLRYGPASQTGEIRQQLDRDFQNVTQWLLNGGIDFDFISESLLPELCEKGGAPLRVGQMAYDAILVPGCETLRNTTLDRLEAFRQAGGRLVFMGEAPRFAEAVPSSRGKALWEKAYRVPFDREALLAALEPIRLVELRDASGMRTENLICQLREDAQDRWLFLAHSAKPYHRDIPKPQKLRLTVEGLWDVTEYDTLSGEIKPLSAEAVRGKTVLNRTLYDLDSLLLRLSPRRETVKQAPAQAGQWKPLPVPEQVEFRLEEENVLLLDKAQASLDGGAWTQTMELLRLDNKLREKLGWQNRDGHVAQPWTVTETEAPHSVKLRFRVFSDREIPGVKLALEQGRTARVLLNGREVGPVEGWFTDKSIVIRTLGNLRRGENIIEATVSFTKRTGLEWCYLLGSFGVKLWGAGRELTELPKRLGFDCVTRQGLPHYGGNITYRIPVPKGGRLRVTVPHYAGAAVRVAVDGQQGYIAYPPYALELDTAQGPHTLEIKLLGHRWNCFGPVHLADPQFRWLGPNCWHTEGAGWTESYRLKPLGLLSAPTVEIME